MLTSIAQDIDRPEWAFYDIFTPGELYALWESLNAYCYLTMGPSLRFGDARSLGPGRCSAISWRRPGG